MFQWAEGEFSAVEAWVNRARGELERLNKDIPDAESRAERFEGMRSATEDAMKEALQELEKVRLLTAMAF